MTAGFLVPTGPLVVEQIIKRSRFITVLEPVQSAAEARALQARLRAEHPDASHHCLAFNAGPPGSTRDIGCSDDGEPAGSAGKPMLNVVLGADVGQFAVVVVRYFGGTKLGVGGLVRAYGGCVKDVLAQLETKPFVPHMTLQLQCDYPDLSLVEHLLSQHHGHIVEQHYGQQIELQLSLPQAQQQAFCAALADGSRGRLLPTLMTD
ncbi:YigZ family protein [Ferrimonas senticii]|uniref:YigZ family protein n=1 Tax=Ferrimonas senticii TaxID=394566 RepID=UPI00054E61A9|nr:YigZ family protein [Ferrimonas senticii]